MDRTQASPMRSHHVGQPLFENLEDRILLTTLHGGEFFVYENSQGVAVRVTLTTLSGAINPNDAVELLTYEPGDALVPGGLANGLMNVVGLLNGTAVVPWPTSTSGPIVFTPQGGQLNWQQYAAAVPNAKPVPTPEMRGARTEIYSIFVASATSDTVLTLTTLSAAQPSGGNWFNSANTWNSASLPLLRDWGNGGPYTTAPAGSGGVLVGAVWDPISGNPGNKVQFVAVNNGNGPLYLDNCAPLGVFPGGMLYAGITVSDKLTAVLGVNATVGNNVQAVAAQDGSHIFVINQGAFDPLRMTYTSGQIPVNLGTGNDQVSGAGQALASNGANVFYSVNGSPAAPTLAPNSVAVALGGAADDRAFNPAHPTYGPTFYFVDNTAHQLKLVGSIDNKLKATTAVMVDASEPLYRIDGVVALSFDVFNNTLYGIGTVNIQQGNPPAPALNPLGPYLISIDTASGAVTRYGNAISGIGGNPVVSLTRIDSTGNFYGVDSLNRLVLIPGTGGAAAVIAPLTTLVGNLPVTGISGLAFIDNSLYGLTATNLYVINPVTGKCTDITPAGGLAGALAGTSLVYTSGYFYTAAASGAQYQLAQIPVGPALVSVTRDSTDLWQRQATGGASVVGPLADLTDTAGNSQLLYVFGDVTELEQGVVVGATQLWGIGSRESLGGSVVDPARYLIQIDTATGTVVAKLAITESAAPSDLSGLTYSTADRTWWGIDDTNQLVTVDMTTGQLTPVGGHALQDPGGNPILSQIIGLEAASKFRTARLTPGGVALGSQVLTLTAGPGGVFYAVDESTHTLLTLNADGTIQPGPQPTLVDSVQPAYTYTTVGGLNYVGGVLLGYGTITSSGVPAAPSPAGPFLIQIDPATGLVTPSADVVRVAGTPVTLRALAVNPNSGDIYGVDISNRLMTIPAAGGNATLVNGTGTLSAAGITALGFVGDVLYGRASNALYRIDGVTCSAVTPAAGLGVAIGGSALTLGSDGKFYTLALVGGQSQLAELAASDTFYAATAGGLVYAVDNGIGLLGAAVAEQVGDLGINVAGLDYNPATPDVLWATESGGLFNPTYLVGMDLSARLIRVDGTGAAIPGAWIYDSVNPTYAYGDENGMVDSAAVLYSTGTINNLDPAHAADPAAAGTYLLTVDTATGVATQTVAGTVIHDSLANPILLLQSIAFGPNPNDPNVPLLYGIDASDNHLLVIDQTTMEATDLGLLSASGITGIDFKNGQLYAVDGTTLYTVDLDNGLAMLPASVTDLTGISGLSDYPGDTSHMLVTALLGGSYYLRSVPIQPGNVGFDMGRIIVGGTIAGSVLNTLKSIDLVEAGFLWGNIQVDGHLNEVVLRHAGGATPGPNGLDFPDNDLSNVWTSPNSIISSNGDIGEVQSLAGTLYSFIYARNGHDPSGFANDRIGTAIPLSSLPLSGPISGSIDTPTQVNMYGFNATAGQQLTLDITDADSTMLNGVFDTSVQLFDANGVLIASNYLGGGLWDTSLSYTFSSDGRYYIGVSGGVNVAYDPATGSGQVAGVTELGYTLAPSGTVRVINELEDISSSGGAVATDWMHGQLNDYSDDDQNHAQFINNPGGPMIVNGILLNPPAVVRADPADWYAIPMMAGQTITIDNGDPLFAFPPGVAVLFRDPTGRWMGSYGYETVEDLGVGSRGAALKPMQITVPEAGVWYMEVIGVTPAYSISVTVNTHAALGGVNVNGDYGDLSGVAFSPAWANMNNFATGNGADLGAVVITGTSQGMTSAEPIGGGNLITFQAGQIGSQSGIFYSSNFLHADGNIGRVASTVGALSANITAGSAAGPRADIQNIVAAGNLATLFNVLWATGDIGVIDVGGTMEGIDLRVNSDGLHGAGHVDLISIRGDFGSGNVLLGIPTLRHGVGGDIGYVSIGGQIFVTDGNWIGPAQPTIYSDGRTSVLNDDGGGRLSLTPKSVPEVDPLTGLPVLDPVTNKQIIFTPTYSFTYIPVDDVWGGIGGVIANITSNGPLSITALDKNFRVDVGYVDLSGAPTAQGVNPQLTIGGAGIANLYYVTNAADPAGTVVTSLVNSTTGGIVSGHLTGLNTLTMGGSLGPLGGNTAAWIHGNDVAPTGVAQATGAQFGWFHGTYNGLVVDGNLWSATIGGSLGDLRVGTPGSAGTGRLGTVVVNSDKKSLASSGQLVPGWDGVTGVVYATYRIDSINVGDGLADDGGGEMPKAAILCGSILNNVQVGSIGAVSITGPWRMLNGQVYGELNGAIMALANDSFLPTLDKNHVQIIDPKTTLPVTSAVDAITSVTGTKGARDTAIIAGVSLDSWESYKSAGFIKSGGIGTVSFSGVGARIDGSEIFGLYVRKVLTSADSDGIVDSFISGSISPPNLPVIGTVQAGGVTRLVVENGVVRTIGGLVGTSIGANGGGIGTVAAINKAGDVIGNSFVATNGMTSISGRNFQYNDVHMPGTVGTITVKGNATDNMVLVGAVNSMAVTGSLNTTLAGWDYKVAGLFGKLTVGGSFNANLTLQGPTTGYLKTMTVGGDISGSITSAGRIGSVVSKKGSISAPITTMVGGWSSDIDLIQAALDLAGTVDSAGSIKKIAVGRNITGVQVKADVAIGTITTGGLLNSRILAGVKDTVVGMPSLATDFASMGSLGSLTFKAPKGGASAVVNSDVAAWSIGTIKMVNVNPNNGGTPMGVTARTIKSYSRVVGKATVATGKNLVGPAIFDQVPTDYLVKLV